MDWRAGLAGMLDAITGRMPAWLAPASMLLAPVLALALAALVVRHLRLRRELARCIAVVPPAAPPPAHPHDGLAAVSLQGEGLALVDRWLPRRPGAFLLAVLALAAGSWGLGLALARDRAAFLATPEWQIQPVYLAAHLITLRLFATAFVRTLLAGVAHLEIATEVAQRRMALVLGPAGAVVAAAAAAPFSVYDYGVLADAANGESTGPASDWLLYGIWCAEWYLMAFIWTIVVGYALLAHWALRRHRFRAPIEVVLHGRLYRPFLQMSGQGATIVLGFWIVNVVYVWYSVAEISDYIGVAVTLALVLAGFLPPLAELRGKVSRAVGEQMTSLRKRLDHSLAYEAPVWPDPTPARTIEERLDAALVMLRISYLERLHDAIGRSEAADIVIKLLVPVTTMAWYGYKYYKGMP